MDSEAASRLAPGWLRKVRVLAHFVPSSAAVPDGFGSGCIQEGLLGRQERTAGRRAVRKTRVRDPGVLRTSSACDGAELAGTPPEIPIARAVSQVVSAMRPVRRDAMALEHRRDPQLHLVRTCVLTRYPPALALLRVCLSDCLAVWYITIALFAYFVHLS